MSECVAIKREDDVLRRDEPVTQFLKQGLGDAHGFRIHDDAEFIRYDDLAPLLGGQNVQRVPDEVCRLRMCEAVVRPLSISLQVDPTLRDLQEEALRKFNPMTRRPSLNVQE